MSLPVILQDGGGSGREAIVLPSGQLAVSPLAASVPRTVSMNATGTGFNFFRPVSDKEGIITEIIISTNKDIGVNGATITIYEAGDEDTATSDRDILIVNLLKNANLPITGLNWLVNEGKFLSAQTDDATVLLTIGLFRIPSIVSDPADLGKGADV